MISLLAPGSWLLGRRRAVLASVLVVAALLRLPLLDRVPNGFFLDEASRGYDAYAIVTTGADQYGVRWPLFAEGIDDYTPALYTYLVVPFVALLGPTEVAVRLPAALVGTGSVGLAYLAAAAFFGPAVALGTAAILAISPWHVLPSRTGAEWVLLPAFCMLGVWLARRGFVHGPTLALAGVVLGIGLYSYAFARLLIPLLALGLGVLWARELRAQLRWSLVGLAVLAALAIPLVLFAGSEAGQSRLRTVVPVGRLGAGELIPYFVGNYLSYFSPEVLVWGAERTHHHRLAGFGPLLLFMIPLVLVGLADCLIRRTRSRLFWLWWLAAAPAASALHRESPSSALLLGAIPSWHVLAALGGRRVVEAVGRFGRPAALVFGLILAFGALTGLLAARALYVDYPIYAARDWEYGAREVVRFIEERRSGYDDVLVDDRLDTPHVLVLFYARVDPTSYQARPIHVRQPNVRSRGEIGPYRFGRIEDLVRRPGRHLVWTTETEGGRLFPGQAPLFAIGYPNGQPGQAVYELRRD